MEGIELLISFFTTVIGIGTLLTGTLLLLYGFYSLSIPDFDKAVRIFSFVVGTLLILIVGVLYLNFQD